MAIGSGQLSIQRFRLLTLGRSPAVEAILTHAISKKVNPIDWDELREEAFGWCDPFSGEVDFVRRDHLVLDHALLLGVRLDQKKVPGTLLRLRLASALRALREASQDQGKKRLPKSQREIIQVKLKEELLKRTLPSVKIAEVVWFFDEPEIWLCGASESFTERFTALFRDTFAFELMPLNSGTLALNLDRLCAGHSEGLQVALNLSPFDFAANSENVASYDSASVLQQDVVREVPF